MGLGIRLQARYRSKNLPEIVEAQTKMGLGVAGVTVKCDGIAMKQLDGGDMRKYVIYDNAKLFTILNCKTLKMA